MGMKIGIGISPARGEGVGVPAPSYDTDAAAYFTAMSVQPDAARKGLLNTLIAGIKGDGDWTGLDWLVLHAAHDAQAGRLNARNPAKVASAVNSPTFTTDRGHTGDGATSYIDYGEVPDAAGNNLSLNSGAWGVYINQQNGAAGLMNEMGNFSIDRHAITARATGGNENFRACDATADTSQANTGSRTGFRATSRTDAAIKRAFFNNTRVADLTTASTTVSTGNFTVLRNVGNYSPDRVAASFSGAGMADAAIERIRGRIVTYLTAIGAN